MDGISESLQIYAEMQFSSTKVFKGGEDSVLMNRVSTLTKGYLSPFFLSTTGGHSNKVPSERNGTLLDSKAAGTMILDVSASIIKSNTLLSFE